jgi:hypothetical protein
VLNCWRRSQWLTQLTLKYRKMRAEFESRRNGTAPSFFPAPRSSLCARRSHGTCLHGRASLGQIRRGVLAIRGHTAAFVPVPRPLPRATPALLGSLPAGSDFLRFAAQDRTLCPEALFRFGQLRPQHMRRLIQVALPGPFLFHGLTAPSRSGHVRSKADPQRPQVFSIKVPGYAGRRLGGVLLGAPLASPCF